LTIHRLIYSAFAFLFLINSVRAQSNDEECKWDHPPIKYSDIKIPAGFEKEDVVIVKEDIMFNFTSVSEKTLKKTITIKILSDKGAVCLDSLILPESFDIAENEELMTMGRASKRKIPFIKKYSIKCFMARKITPRGAEKTEPHYHADQVRWIKETGEFIEDYKNRYSFKGLSKGDVLEYSYEATFYPNYGNDVFYFNSKWPKLNTTFSYKYLALNSYKNYKFVFTKNIPDSSIQTTSENLKEDICYVTQSISLKNLPRINYFINAFSSEEIPFIYFNFNYSIKLMDFSKYPVAGLPDFKWTNTSPLQGNDIKYNIKRNTDTREFLQKIDSLKTDSTAYSFCKRLVDTLNTFKYYSTNYLFYNDPRLYGLFSTEHLLKHRLVEYKLVDVYEGILNNKRFNYYVCKIQDKRLGDQNPLVRVNKGYENILLAVRKNNTLAFIIPRYSGLKYFINELPFYYEGALVATFPSDYSSKKENQYSKQFKFYRTPKTGCEQNVRIEDCEVRLAPDSGICFLKIQEHLNGQFSTIQRPKYLNELIDSTVNPLYYRRCVDKPYCTNKTEKLVYKSEEFPFRHVFECSGICKLENKNDLDLSDWFSFLLSGKTIPEKPTHNYYFDFPFTDTYNFTIRSSKKISVLNAADFSEDIDNDYFELKSFLENKDGSVVLGLSFKVKKQFVPKEDANELMKIINKLDVFNRKVIHIKYNED
jgi:hypothetical protein